MEDHSKGIRPIGRPSVSRVYDHMRQEFQRYTDESRAKRVSPDAVVAMSQREFDDYQQLHRDLNQRAIAISDVLTWIEKASNWG